MLILKGKGVSDGVAIGKLYHYQRQQVSIKRQHVSDVEKEIARYEDAKEKAILELQNLYEQTMKDFSESDAMIFEIHKMMLEDADFNSSVADIIRKDQINAEFAVGVTADQFSNMFSSMDDEYMKERAKDVSDISERVLKILSNSDHAIIQTKDPVILIADDLLPSETVQLEKDKLLGFVTMHGSSNSHTAILARTMNLPAVIRIGENDLADFHGCDAIIDGFDGVVYVSPDDATIRRMTRKKLDMERQEEEMRQMIGTPSITADGQKVEIYANIGHLADAGSALANDAEGVGLFRSEFIYLERNDYPTEEEQFSIYQSVAEKMKGKKVVIRTLDIGADKQASYFGIPKEENPAMGYRAIRICLDRTEIFKTQLRAIYRASAFGNLAIMFPMIISLEEVRQIKQIIQQVKQELTEQNIPFSEEIEIGIMIETPASALITDQLAKEVDFFSVGTNDLTQYTLAIDRQNPMLDNIYNPHHKAILRLLKIIADNAHKNGIWVGICGELASDLSLTEIFLALGIDELSVAPASILKLRKKVTELDIKKSREQILNQILGENYEI